nr:hypothetical protein [Tanacetum cinerariifolium]
MDNLSTFDSVLAFRRNTKVVRNVVLLYLEIETDAPLLGELREMGEPLGAKVDEPMVGPVVDELARLIVKVEEQMVAPVIDMEGDLAMLFADDNFSDDGPDDDEDDEEIWEVNEEWLMAPVTTPPMPVMPLPSTYEVGVIEYLCTRMGNLEYRHGKLVKKVIKVSDVKVADGISIGEIGLRVSAVEGQCILEIDRRLADLKRRPSGPQ